MSGKSGANGYQIDNPTKVQHSSHSSAGHLAFNKNLSDNNNKMLCQINYANNFKVNSHAGGYFYEKSD
jgi:hypothetical protein